MGEAAVGPPAGALGTAGGGLGGLKRIVPIAIFGLLIFMFLIGYLYFGGNKKVTKKYVILYSQMDPTVASQVLQELSFQKINFETLQTGKFITVKVPQDKLTDARNILAMKGLPSGGTKGYELFDQSTGLGTTEFDKKIRFIRAVSGELERAISRFDYIETAKVQISIPEKRIFSTYQPPVRASVMVKKREGYTVSNERILSIVYLVSRAVPELEPQNITVVDFEGNVLSNNLNFPKRKQIITGYEEENENITEEDLLAIKSLRGKNIEWGKEKEEVSEGEEKTAVEETKEKKEETKKAFLTRKDNLDEWLKYNIAEEKRLKEKIEEQLNYIIPEDIFHVGVDIKFKKTIKDQVPEVKRISVTVLIDSTTEYPIREQKVKIYRTVASTVGYIKKRDHIEVRFTPFIHKKTAKNGSTNDHINTSGIAFWGIIYGLQKIGIIYIILGLFFIIILGVIIYKVIGGGRKKEKEFERPVVTREKEEPETETVKQVESIKNFASENPDKLAQVLKTWLSEEK